MQNYQLRTRIFFLINAEYNQVGSFFTAPKCRKLKINRYLYLCYPIRIVLNQYLNSYSLSWHTTKKFELQTKAMSSIAIVQYSFLRLL